MAYFRCTTGGSGKGNTLVVTCADDLAGATITCTNGTKTYRKTCPSTAPYEVTFYGLEAGTWTVSTTVSGSTYTTTVVITDYEAELGGFNWRTWVDTASQLDSSDYNSLDEVLADEEAVRELCLEHACVDYFADIATTNEDVETIINNDLFAKWVNNSDYALDNMAANSAIKAVMDEADKYGYGEWALMPQVPTMTSNTAPYGEAKVIGVTPTNHPAYYAFDGNDETWAGPDTSMSGSINIAYEFISPINIRCLKIRTLNNSAYSGMVVRLGYSDDGSLYTYSEEHTVTIGGTYVDLNVVDYGYHKYWCASVDNTQISANNFAVSSLQFYAWAPKGNVPIMTANNAPYGTANATSAYSGWPAYCAFDGNDSTFWAPDAGAGTNAILYWNPVVPVRATKIKYRSDNARATSIEIQGWNVEGDYHQLALVSPSGTGEQYFDLSGDIDYYAHYCLIIRATSADLPHVNTLQFYGRELKDLVPPMISNTLPSGEASANHETYPAYYSFNKNFSTTNGWYTYEHTVTDEWLKYKFDSQVDVKFIKLTLTGASKTSHAYKSIFQGSNDDNTWENITDELSYTIADTSTIYTYFQRLITDNPYQYYRLKFTYSDATGANAITPWIIEIQIYGKDYSEKEFEEGTTKKWLYDHGVDVSGVMQEVSTENGYSFASSGYTFVKSFIEESFVKCKSASSSQQSGIAFPNIESEITSHDIVKLRYNSIINHSSVAAQLRIQTSKVIGGSGSVSVKSLPVPQIYFPEYLDISNVTTGAVLAIMTYDIMETNIEELWLE